MTEQKDGGPYILELPPIGYVEFMENMTRPQKPSDLMQRAKKLHDAMLSARGSHE